MFILKPKNDPKKLRIKIDQFLAIRGLEVKEAKTKLIASTEVFDFLGWHFKVKRNGKFISTPSDKNYRNLIKKVKTSLKDSRFKLEARIQKVASIIRGWRNYHKYCDMKNHDLWALRYWTWKFIRKQGRYNRQQTNEQKRKAFPPIPWTVNKFINVKGTKSPFDGDITYWSKRNSALYDSYTSRALKRQGHKCGDCSLAFMPGEKVELHHIDGNHNNWKTNNLIALHRSCHQGQEVHSSKVQQKQKLKVS